MSDENELLEPLATEAGQQAIARAINNLSSLEYAVRAERAATNAAQSADEALNSANDASDSETMARKWATKTDGAVAQETIEIPPEQEGDDPTTETINLYSARYYAALAEETYNNMQFDNTPTENSTNLLSSGTIYTALYGKADKSNTYTKTEVDTQISTAVSDLINSAPSALDTLEELANALGDDPNFATTIATQLGNKADKSDTYTKTEVDTALGNVQSTLTFDNVPTANSDNPVKSSGIKTALDGKQDTLTFDSTPTQNSTNPVTSGGVYTSLQNVNIDIDDEITEDSDNPVTSAAIYAALQNVPSGGGSSVTVDNNLTLNSTNPVTSNGICAALNTILSGSSFSFTCDPEYLSHTAGEILFENGDRKLYKGNSSPAIAFLYNYRNYWNFCLMSFSYEACSVTGNTSASNYAEYVDSARGVTWCLRVCQLNQGYTNSNYPILNNGNDVSSLGDSGIRSKALSDANTQVITSKTIIKDNLPIYGSQNIVLSGGVYNSIYNTLEDIVTQGQELVNDGLYYCDTQDAILYRRDSVYVKKTNSIPAIGALYNYSGYYHFLLLSLVQSGTEMYKTNNNTDSTSGTYVDQGRGVTWYYREMGLGQGYSSCDYPLIYYGESVNSFSTDGLIARFLQEANPVIATTNRVVADSIPIQNSTNVITSGAVYDALQNAGGGSSITVDSTITQGGTNPVEGGAIYTALDNKADKSITYTKTEVDTAISSKGDVTTDTNQNITGTKTFVGSKKIAFKQSTANDKLGFTLFGNTGTERGYLEFNPTNTIDGVAGLMTLGNYATSAGALTQVGFRRYSNISGASGAYNLLMPMVADARTPFSLTTTYTNFYLPLGFTDGTNTVRTAKSGVVDLSPLLASLEARIAALEGN